jgi:hypothetical protein
LQNGNLNLWFLNLYIEDRITMPSRAEAIESEILNAPPVRVRHVLRPAPNVKLARDEFKARVRAQRRIEANHIPRRVVARLDMDQFV